jgi:hypothetical protein
MAATTALTVHIHQESKSGLAISGLFVARVIPRLFGLFAGAVSDRMVDGYVHERPAIFVSTKHRLAGRNWTTRFTYEWITRLGVYRLTGMCTGRRRMPAGERCRKAGCGRTACTV